MAANQLRRLVLKEIADNALDAGAAVGFAFVDEDPDRYFIEDDGPGLHGTPQDIAELFSIARPLRSSKLLRLPQRGQVGNGLRVVAGAVLASSGTLAVVTHNQRIALRPESDGSTRVVKVTKADQPVGTRIEIGFGPMLSRDPDPFAWVGPAHAVRARRSARSGRTFSYRARCGRRILRNCLRAAFARGPTGARAPKCWPRRGRLSTVRPWQRMR